MKKFFVEPYTPIGVRATHSFTEPLTQKTLKVFHLVGALEVAIESGKDRFLEIIDARKKIATPYMEIHVLPKYKKQINKLAKSIVEVRLKDVAKIKEDFTNKETIIELDTKKIKEYDIPEEKIEKEIKKAIEKTRVKMTKSKNQIKLTFMKTMKLRRIREVTLKLEKLLINGIEGIKLAIPKKDVIYTSGSNFKEIMKLEWVDKTKTKTNNILELFEVLGIEAARELIYRELMNVKEALGFETDPRYFSLLADAMTKEGVVLAVGRHGLSGIKASVLMRAAFEETNKHLISASVKGEKDNFDSIIPNIIVGLPPKVGTGKVIVKYKWGE
jgi:DNA-directed RNA polymerase subunit A"